MGEQASILIVDDDESIFRTLTLILGKKGYEVETAGTGREAIEKAKGRFFNLAFLEIRLPDIEGLELLAPLKEMHPDMVVLMAAAFASVETAVRALNEGASGYITKPLDVDQALAMIHETLEKQRLVMENRRLYGEAQRELAERVRVEEAPRQERDVIAAILDTAGALIVVLDQEGRIVRFNRTCEQVTGYAFHEVRDKHFWDFLLIPEEIGPVKAVFEELRAGLFPSKYENYWAAKDGERRLIAWSNTCILDTDGSVKYVIGTGIDITERKQAKEALKETRDYLDKLIRYASAPIIVWDSDQRITRFNAAFENLTGHTADEVVGQELSILFPEASRDETLREITRTLSNEYWESVEIPILRKDGETRLALWNSANVYDDGDILATIAQGIDITERKRAEEALRQERDVVAAILDTAGALIVVLDPEGRIVRFNRTCEQVTGYAFHEVRDKYFWDFLLIPEEIEPVKAVFEELRSGLSPNKFENYWVTKDGERRLINWSNTSIFDTDGSVKYAIGTGIDITERVRAEEEIRKLNKELEQRVLERTAELQQANDDLRRFANLAAGRELRMVELKEEIKQSKAQLEAVSGEGES